MPCDSKNLTRDECVQAVVLMEEEWKIQGAGSHLSRPGASKNRATTLVQDRFLRLSALRQRFVTLRSLLI
ncbi:hypothetical protein ILUMI_21225 [Ignelater luminosus]|uniref:Uncharacterized protein n=1 Tax=Ignelater luminosus TaxID=2038154 RepID=A0A8K0CCU8_IGNLU|nr:hypothetical protein ILUMI_21225 [Ignelater luminosus]